MMFSRRLAFLAVLCVTSAAAQQSLRGDDVLQALENKDLTDLLDADLDEKFLQQAPRRLQEEATASPTSVPTLSASTPSPTLSTPTPSSDGEREIEFTFSPTPAPSSSTTDTFSPTSSPSSSTRDLVTEAPAAVTSGASSWRSSAGVASALVFVGSVAAAAVM